MADSAAKALALAALAYKGEHASGNYPDIANKPKLNNVTINGSHNSAYYKLPLLAETGHSINFVSDSEYNLTIELLNKDGDVISTSSVDLPLESMIMDGRYEEDSEGKGYLILTLQNGHEIAIPLEGLIDELATKEYVDALHTSEMNARILADSELWEALDLETDTRIDADLDLQAHIDSERDARELGDSELSNRIDTLTIALDSEAEFRLEQDTIILNKLDSEAETREEADLYLEFLIDSEGRTREEQIRAFRVALDSEALIRAEADSELLAKLNDKQDKLTFVTPLVNDSETISLKYDRDTLKVNSEGELEVIGGGGGTTAYLNGVLLDSEANTESAKIIWYGDETEYQALVDQGLINDYTMYIVEDSEGTIRDRNDYEKLENKPAINGVTLSGNKSLSSFGIQPVMNGTNPIRIAGNQISLAYNEDQFYIGAGDKLFYYDKVAGFEPDITFADGFVGIYGGINVNKYASGLYSGSVRLMAMNALTAGTPYKVATAFGDGEITFNSFCLGFDDLTYTPMCVKIENGEVWLYPTINIPARGVVGFTFLASV